MIKSFAHKGLREFYESGSKKGIQPEHAPKLGRMLDRLDASISPQDMNLPGYRLHPLKGDKQDMWANYRMWCRKKSLPFDIAALYLEKGS